MISFLKVTLTVLNLISALLIALAADSIPLTAWPVWVVFLINVLILGIMAYISGWIYASVPWKNRRI